MLGIKKTLFLFPTWSFSHKFWDENVFHLELFTQDLGLKKSKKTYFSPAAFHTCGGSSKTTVFHLGLSTLVGVVKNPFFT
jgi:hypothetical protein